MPRKVGKQTPTQSVILPYSKTKGKEAVRLYNTTGTKALKWQAMLCNDIMAVDKTAFGFIRSSVYYISCFSSYFPHKKK